MRELTIEEMSLVCGGDIDEITVTAPPKVTSGWSVIYPDDLSGFQNGSGFDGSGFIQIGFGSSSKLSAEEDFNYQIKKFKDHITTTKVNGDLVTIQWKDKVTIKGYIPTLGYNEVKSEAGMTYTGEDKHGYGFLSKPNGIPDVFDKIIQNGGTIIWGGR